METIDARSVGEKKGKFCLRMVRRKEQRIFKLVAGDIGVASFGSLIERSEDGTGQADYIPAKIPDSAFPNVHRNRNVVTNSQFPFPPAAPSSPLNSIRLA